MVNKKRSNKKRTRDNNRGSFFSSAGGRLRPHYHSIDAIAVTQVIAHLIWTDQLTVIFAVFRADTRRTGRTMLLRATP
jgi:hypothetical protein